MGSLQRHPRTSIWYPQSPLLGEVSGQVTELCACVGVYACVCVCAGAALKSQDWGSLLPICAFFLVFLGTQGLPLLSLCLLCFLPIDCTASESPSQSHLPAPVSLLTTVEFNACC